MALLTWRVPSFDPGGNASTIDIPNVFPTAYPDDQGEWDDALYRADAISPETEEQARDFEMYFGKLPTDIYHALYQREFIRGSRSLSETGNEQLHLLDGFCDDIDDFIWRARAMVRTIDEEYPRFLECQTTDQNWGLPEERAFQDDLYGFLEIVHSQVFQRERQPRKRGSSNEERRSLEVREVRESVPQLESSFETLWSRWGGSEGFPWNDFVLAVESARELFTHGRRGEGRQAFRELRYAMGGFYEARFAVVEKFLPLLRTRRGEKRELLYAIKDEYFDELFPIVRGRLIVGLQDALYECLATSQELTPDGANEKIRRLKKEVKGIDPTIRGKASSFYKLYCENEDKGPCFALLHVASHPKDAVAFSGCFDGALKIAAHFNEKVAKAIQNGGRSEFYEAYKKAFDDISAAPGFASQFCLARIGPDVAYCYSDGGQTRAICLGESLRASDSAYGKGLMFSCCERKLLAWLRSCLPHVRRGKLIIRRRACDMCSRAIEHYEAARGIKITWVDPVYAQPGKPLDKPEYTLYARMVRAWIDAGSEHV